MNRNHNGIAVALGAVALAITLHAGVSLHGRALASPDGSDAPAPVIATCSLIGITNELMESERFLPDREARREELVERTGVRDLADRLNELREELAGADPQDETLNPRRAEALQLQQQYLQLERAIVTELQALTAMQFKEAYGLARASAVAIAEDLGFNYVVSSIDPEEPMVEGPMEASVRDVLGRTLVHFPEGVDITPDVRDDLNLD